jgi:hypothetical protein
MCVTCYDTFRAENPNDFPLPTTKQMREIVNLIDEFYEDWFTGGALHIVLDDWNLEDEDITWCLQNSDPDLQDDRVKLITGKLLQLTLAERYEVLRLREHPNV